MAIVFNAKGMLVSGVLVTVFLQLIGLDKFGFTFQSFYSSAIIEFDYILAQILMGSG